MIVYFADRKLNILGQASTGLPAGLSVSNDKKTEETETGVAIFECDICFSDKTRAKAEACGMVGNFILRSHEEENEFYTIIDTELDTKKQTMYIYAEDAGLDLINEVVGEYAATEAETIDHYVETFAYDSGFRIGINQAAGITKKLTFDNEQTVTARLANIAKQFGDFEISFSYKIKGLQITNKLINIYKKRGQDNGVTLRLNRDIDKIIVSKTITNLATALRATGGTPDNQDNPITLRGYAYDDGDFYIDGDCLKSRKALQKWSRYLNPNEPNLKEGHEGHIVRLFSYDTVSQAELLQQTLAELKAVCDFEANYDAEIKTLRGAKIGDRINIVDEAGKLYLSTRLLKVETSVEQREVKAVLGENLIRPSGISQKVANLAKQFAINAKDTTRALASAVKATEAAEQAQGKANNAATEAEKAQQAATEATTEANKAQEAATDAKTKADNAQSAVDSVEEKLTGLENTVANAQQAAANAQQAADTAWAKADEAADNAAKAKAEAANANAAVTIAQEKAEQAVTNAGTAQATAETAIAQAEDAKSTAAAAKLDAEIAKNDIAGLGDRLETVTETMEADYTRKTDLTDTVAHLQSQISKNAGLLSSTVSLLSIIDETANNAQDQAEAAQKKAEEAAKQAAIALQDAEEAQAAADQAATAYQNAQANADNAKAAADEAEEVLTNANAALAAAQADLETVLSRGDATEAEIAQAQEAVTAAQQAANIAKQSAASALETATNAQQVADSAKKEAEEAQAAAETAASYAKIAQSMSGDAQNAANAQAKADQATKDATTAQNKANEAANKADEAKERADNAAKDAAQAVADAEAADALAVQAAENLVDARKRLAAVLSDSEATQADVEAAQEAVRTAQSALDQAKASATKAAAYAAQAAIDATEAQAQADTAQSAADKAKKAADDAKDAADVAAEAVAKLAIRVTQAETDIIQNSDRIELVAQRTESVQIGGRNLLRFTQKMPVADTRANGFSLYGNGNLEQTESGIKFTFSGETETAVVLPIAYEGCFGNIKNLTLSFEYRGNIVYPGNLVFLQKTKPHKSRNLKSVAHLVEGATEWKRYEATFDGSDVDVRVCYGVFLFHGLTEYTADNWIEVKSGSLKLESGNKATAWTPAVEDMATGDDLGGMIGTLDAVTKAFASLDIKADEINTSVKTLKENTDSAIGAANDTIKELQNEVAAKMTAEAVELQIKSAMDNGTSKVVTETGFTFNGEGLTISKTDSELETQITENGMSVYQSTTDGKEKVLTADNQGVEAKNLHATTYLIVGNNSRFEDYGADRTGCFWMGG